MINIKVIASGSDGNCYRICDGRTSLLLDAGIPFNKIREGCNFQSSALSGALITHRHNDHAKAVPELIRNAIDVYAQQDVFESKKITESHRMHVIKSGIVQHPDDEHMNHFTRIGTFNILPFDVHHDVPTLGFYIVSTHTRDCLLYFTDTYYIDYKFNRVDYLMAEANYDTSILQENIKNSSLPPEFKKRLVRSHMSIATLLELLRANDMSNCKQIYLLHLSDNNSNAEKFRKRVQSESGCEVYVC